MTFLFFVLVSCCMWLLQTLNDKYETSIPFTLVIENKPTTADFEEGERCKVDVVLRDYGTVLMGYIFDGNKEIKVDYSEFTDVDGRLTLPVSAIKSRVMSAVEPSTTIIQFVDDEVVLNLKSVVEKKPVVVTEDFMLADNCDILSIEAVPSTVTVTALPSILASLDNIATASLRGVRVTCDTTVNVALDTPVGVLASPTNVKVKIAVSSVVRKEVRVPLELVNFPPFSDWTTFPVAVDIAFDVEKADYDKVGPGDFEVLIDYNDYLNTPEGADVAIILSSTSPMASNVEIAPSAIIKSSPLQISTFGGGTLRW